MSMDNPTPRPVARRHGLRFKLLLASGAAMLAVVLATAGMASWLAMQQHALAQQSRSQAIAEALASQLERILALEIPLRDLQGFDEQCDEALARHAGLAFALVLDTDGQPVFRSGRTAAPAPVLPALARLRDPAAGPLLSADGRAQLAVVPVRPPGGGVQALAVVGFSRDLLHAERNALLLRALGFGALVLLLALGVMYAVVSRVMLRPLSVVVQAVDRIRQGGADYALRLQPRGDDELAVLCQGFNRLLQDMAVREADLRAARDTAEVASQAKTQFLAVMSHELRTPLNAMLGMAELLGNTALDARQRRYVQQVRAAGRSLAGLIGDVLDLSSIEVGQVQIIRAPFALRDVVDESVALFAEDARQRGVRLSLAVDEALPDQVLGDALRTRQILVNLLSNAMKFTERGSVALSVTPAGAAVRFSVADTGLGIAPDLLPHIYEAFRQGDGSSTRRFGGAGLGLTIARQLCEALGGRIDVSSRPGKGSTFWFELPLPAAPAAVADAAPAVAVATAARRPAPEPLPPGAGARPGPGPGGPLEVLLIEDNAANREYVEQCLAAADVRLDTGLDGLDGLTRLRERAYDVVLLDWQLPGIDGLAVLAMLRELELQTGRPRAHVIAVTAHAAPGDRETCLAAGVDDYLAKPFGCDALLDRLAALRPVVPATGADQAAAAPADSAASTAASRRGNSSGLVR